MSLKHLGYMRFKIDFDLNGNSSKARSIRLHLITHDLKSERVFGLSAFPSREWMYVSVVYACMLNVFYTIWKSDIMKKWPHFPACCQATLHISTAVRKAFFLLLSFAKLALNVYLITTLQNRGVFKSSLEWILNPSLSLLFLMCQVLSNSISYSHSIATDKDDVYLPNHQLRLVFFPNIFSISGRIAPAWKGTLLLYIYLCNQQFKRSDSSILLRPLCKPRLLSGQRLPELLSGPDRLQPMPFGGPAIRVKSQDILRVRSRVRRKFHCCHSSLPTFPCCKTFEIQQAATASSSGNVDHAKLPVPDWHNVATCI